MRIASFWRHFAVIAAVALLAWPAGAGPGRPSHRGQPDEVPIGRLTPDDNEESESTPADEGRQTGEGRGDGRAPGDGKDGRADRDSNRGKLTVRQRVLLDLANQCRQRTRDRARTAAQSASTRSLVRTILRRP